MSVWKIHGHTTIFKSHVHLIALMSSPMWVGRILEITVTVFFSIEFRLYANTYLDRSLEYSFTRYQVVKLVRFVYIYFIRVRVLCQRMTSNLSTTRKGRKLNPNAGGG